MKIRFTNFGYHQLIEKRDIPLDRNIRKPKVLSVFEMVYLVLGMLHGVFAMEIWSGSNYFATSLVVFGGVLYLAAAYFSAVESSFFRGLAVLASVYLGLQLVIAGLSGLVNILVVGIACILVVAHIGTEVFSSSVIKYSRWVSGNDNGI